MRPKPGEHPFCYHEPMAHLLLIEGKAQHWPRLAQTLESNGFRVTLRGGSEDLSAECLAPFDAVLARVESRGQIQALGRRTAAPLIVLAIPSSVREAVCAMKLGATDYLQLPVEPEELIAAVEQALSAGRGDGAGNPFQPSPLLGGSPAMSELRTRIAKLAPIDVPVLIEGEHGVGKKLVARALHAASKRNLARLIAVHCGQIHESMIEGELFGHELPTGGVGSGLVQAADGGTLFLDEVGDLPPKAQGRLLRLLERDGAHPAGSRTDVRVVAATHLSLAQLAESGQFRSDLHRQLNLISLFVPPLRERREDIPELAQHFLAQACGKLGKSLPILSEAALDAMQAHRWPRNIRQLENTIERAAILCDDGRIEPQRLAIIPSPGPRPEAPWPQAEDLSLEDYFVRFVQENEERLTETELAERLGISRKSLWERRQRLRIPRKKTRKRGLEPPGH